MFTTGHNTSDDGLDIVIEGPGAQVSDPVELHSVADTYESKYGRHLTATDGTWSGLGDTIRGCDVVVYRVTRATGFAAEDVLDGEPSVGAWAAGILAGSRACRG